MSHEAASLLTLLESAAREAGDYLMTGYRTRPRTREKGLRDLVTEFDVASEKLLMERLGRVRDMGIAIVAEEGGGERAARTLYIDPIDGTVNFAHGHPFFCISLGLVEGDTLQAGVVHAPALGVTWAAMRGQGATRNGEPCRVSHVPTIEEALLATGFSPRVREQADFDRWIRVKKRAQAMRRCGSAALDLCLVADGTYDGYWERNLNPWDLAGGACLVREAGGRVTGMNGGEFDPVTGHICATNGAVHEALAALIAT